ncbi:MAG: ABC transporter ATP-binding protein [Actinomycetota bacterium]
MSKNALIRCWTYAKPHARGLAASLVAGIGMILAGLAIPPIVGAVVDDLTKHRSGPILPLGLLVLAVGAVEAVLAYTRRFTAAKASIAMERDMRDEIYGHLQSLPVSFHDNWQSGQLLSRAMSDLSTLRRFIGFGLLFLVMNLLQFCVVAYLMIRISPNLALFTGAIALPVMLLTWNFDHRYHAVSRRVQDTQGDLTTIVEESATGLRIIKAFGRARLMSEKFRRQAELVLESNMDGTRLRATFWSLLHLLPNINFALVLAVGGYGVVRGNITLGGLTTFIGYLSQLSWPIRSVGWILANAEEARTAAERYFEAIDTPPAISSSEAPLILPSPLQGTIGFEHVSFRYPESNDWILRDTSLIVNPGETVAIVGATGSGKTSLVSLVPRLYDVTEGKVTIDGIDIRDVMLSELRSHVGVAFEDSILFSMSVRENLLLGAPNATEEDIASSLETAHATFVYELPWGLDTRIGEQGYSLSGGQRQRLALARAVIRKPQLLVLDDPLSAVDVHTEAQIEAALASVLQGVTALLVVHRPSTLALADRVALLHDGRIAAVGSHSELMASDPLYRSLLSQEPQEASR